MIVASRRARFGVLFLTILLDLLGFGMILPLLPFYAQRFGADAFQIGLLFASFSLAQFVFAPLWGRLSDHRGRRPVLLGLISVSVAAYFLFAAAPSLTWLFAARTLSGIAAASYSIAQAYAADISAPGERSMTMGRVMAAFPIGFILGPGLGGLLGHWGYTAVPVGAALLAALNLLLAFVFLPESRPREVGVRETPASATADWRSAHGQVTGLLLLSFSTIFCFAAMEATLALFCEEQFGFGLRQTSWLFVYVGVILAVIHGVALGPLVRRFGERRLIPSGIVLMACGLVLIPLTPVALFLTLTTLPLAFGSGIYNPSVTGLLSRLTEASRQGRILGLARSLGALARVLGPIWGGWTFHSLGSAWPYWTSGGLMGLTLLLAWWVLRGLPEVE